MVVLKRKKEKVPEAKFVKYITVTGDSVTVQWWETLDGPWPYGKTNLKVYDKR